MSILPTFCPLLLCVSERRRLFFLCVSERRRLRAMSMRDVVSQQSGRLSAWGCRVETTPTKGRRVVAERRFNAGDVVFASAPFASVLLAREDRCEWCFRESCRLRCSKCKARFCSPECQKRGWRGGHREECNLLRDDVPADLRLAARVATNMSQKDVMTRRVLRSTAADARAMQPGPDNGERDDPLTKAVATAFGISEASLRRCLKVGRANDFCSQDDLLAPVAAVCLPLAALVNHDCSPNCVSTFDMCKGDDGLVHRFIACRSIESGDEITHSYVDASEPRELRRSKLHDRYGFDCGCQRCQQEKDNAIDDAVFDVARRLRYRAALCDDDDDEAALLAEAATALANVPDAYPDVLATLQLRAENALARDQRYDAVHLFKDLAHRRMRLYDHPHPRVALDLLILRDAAIAANDLRTAREAHQRVIPILRATKPSGSFVLREHLDLEF